MADARFAKPIDTALVEQLARHHEVLITIEEGSIGGFARQVLQHLAWKGLLDRGLKVRPMVLPDIFIDHDSQAKQLAEAGLSAQGHRRDGAGGDRRGCRAAGRAGDHRAVTPETNSPCLGGATSAVRGPTPHEPLPGTPSLEGTPELPHSASSIRYCNETVW